MQSASTRVATRAGYTVARALAAPPGLAADAAAADLGALARQWQASGLLPVTGDQLSAGGRAASIPRLSANGATIAAVVGPDDVIWQPGCGKATATIATVGSGGAVAVSPGGQLVAAPGPGWLSRLYRRIWPTWNGRAW